MLGGMACFFQQPLHAESQKRALLILSYHPTFPTFFDQIEGVRSGFEGQNIGLDIEFMDTKRFNDPQNLDNFYQSLAYKISKNLPYDIILVADDNALAFVLTHEADLFADIPVVFFGVNNQELALEQNENDLVTGVIEAVSMRETIALMSGLAPGNDTIEVIVDNTLGGQGDLQTLKNLAGEFPGLSFKVISLNDMTFAELAVTLQGLDASTPVLLLSAYNDSAGTTLSFDESLALITTNLDAPLYHLWYHGMGKGVLGGVLISHFVQGQTAASLAVKILEGTPPSALPVIQISPNTAVFDYSQMVRFGIRPSDLPPDHVIINQPETFYMKYKNLVWTISGILLVLSGLVVVLSVGMARQRAIELQLRASKERYRTYVDSAPYGVFVLDGYGRCLDANNTAAELTGYNQTDLLNIPFSSLMTGHEPENTLIFLDQARRLGRGEQELLFRRADGDTFNMLVKAVPIGFQEYLAFCSDITERLRAEQALQQSHTRLAQTLDQLTNTQEQLLRQERLAAVGQLAAGIAHDFNNILASIMLYADMASRDMHLSKVLRERMETIVRQTERGAALVQQILDFARKSIVDLRPLDLSDFIKETVALLERTLPENIRVTLSLEPGEYVIEADSARIQQVILNLALNARNAMLQGGILHIALRKIPAETPIRCICCDHLPNGPWLSVAVSDTGSGIPDEVLAHIFEPFFTTRAPLGSGLGLAQVYGIVKQHGGHIAVETAVGQGTTFTFYLHPATANIPTLALPKISAPKGRQETILVVEDDASVRIALIDVLQSLNYRTLSAADGREAIRCIAQEQGDIALILSDQVMPEMGGLELAQELLKQQIPGKILLVTGHSLGETAVDQLPPNILGWLKKPLAIETVAQEITAILGREN